ncbi:unnamed protein product [Calypogeia fissa]
MMPYELAFDLPEGEGKANISLEHSEEQLKLIVACKVEFNRSEDEKKVITAEEKITAQENVITAGKLPEYDSCTAIVPLKRTLGDTSSDTAVASSSPSSPPTKHQKKDVIGGLEVQDFLPNGGNFDGQVIAEVDGDEGGGAMESEPISEERSPSGRPDVDGDGDVGGGAIESEPVTKEKSLTDIEGGRDNAGSECGQKRKSDAQSLKSSSGTIGEEGRDECRWKRKSDPILLSSSDDDAASSDQAEEDEEDEEDEEEDEEENEDDQDQDEDEEEEEDDQYEDDEDEDEEESSTSLSSFSSNEPSKVCIRRSNLPSVLRWQQDDRELQTKIHRVENDYYYNEISREVYNEQRSELYTEEEMTAKGIVWPRREEYSPAGFREDELEHVKNAYFSKQVIDDLLFEFGCPFRRDGDSDEEAAKKRWMDEIESKFQDPEAKTAEYKRWEKIREVETEYHHKRIDRDEYNELRFALYTEEEREARGVVWPNEECHSPAGYREEVLERSTRWEVDCKTRMEFHLPIPPDDSDKEEDFCELCISAVKKDKLKKEKEERRYTEMLRDPIETAAAKGMWSHYR